MTRRPQQTFTEEVPVSIPAGLPGRIDAGHREAAADLLRALAAPTRIAIVLAVRDQARCVHELVGELGLSQPLISQHLRVLKDAGVVRGHRSGREIMYELIDDHLAHIVVDAIEHAMEPRDNATDTAPPESGSTSSHHDGKRR